jgi:uncharacterized protein (TIGR00290 family)
MTARALVAWSSGKDSAWALHEVRRAGDVDVVGLLTTITEPFSRVAMHAVREELLDAQAAALRLPCRKVRLPWPCPNETYEARMAEALADARAEGVTHVVFGDLFLADIRAYREEKLAGTGIAPLFPLWGRDTTALARTMIEGGLRATLTCVDPRALDARFAGRAFDGSLLAELPDGVDPCGENGEFHSFAWAGPMFDAPIPVAPGEVVVREGFVFADLVPAPR